MGAVHHRTDGHSPPGTGVSIISIAMDAPQDAISALSGKLGSLPGVSSKVIYTKA